MGLSPWRKWKLLLDDRLVAAGVERLRLSLGTVPVSPRVLVEAEVLAGQRHQGVEDSLIPRWLAFVLRSTAGVQTDAAGPALKAAEAGTGRTSPPG